MNLNTTVYNRTTDAGRVLIVGPSLGGNSVHQWTKVAAELLNDARVVFVDLPGTGLGAVWDDADEPTLDTVAAGIADVARGLREELGDVSVYFAGLSISGATALHLARDYGDLFAGVVVVASAATVGEGPRWIERAEQVEGASEADEPRNGHQQHGERVYPAGGAVCIARGDEGGGRRERRADRGHAEPEQNGIA